MFEENSRYILITQCLQNDFFINQSASTCLPIDEVQRILLGYATNKTVASENGKYVIPSNSIKKGPLGLFLKTIIDDRCNAKEGPILYVINIRDWHIPGKHYDEERKQYGAHCEAGSEGAGYINGIENYLDPEGSKNEMPKPYKKGMLRVYHVLSNSVFDFGAGCRSEIEQYLEVLLFGSSEKVSKLIDHDPKKIEIKENEECIASTYIAIIGAYTDIKIQTLLIGIRSQYPVSNLMVSDSLTASPSLERHIGALDFCSNVLDVEVSHDLNDIIRFLGIKKRIENSSLLIGKNAFYELRSYKNDKQLILADKNKIFDEYISLSQNRSADVYNWVWGANRFLILFGGMFLVVMLWGILSEWEVERLGILGGFGIAQILAGFFSGPMHRSLKNLTNLVSLRVVLENHSLKSSLVRFHLTTAEVLRQNLEEERAKTQIEILKSKLQIINSMEIKTYEALDRLGFSAKKMATILEDTNERNKESPITGSSEASTAKISNKRL